eukprot:c19620_g1_i1 orf=33-1832(+)
MAILPPPLTLILHHSHSSDSSPPLAPLPSSTSSSCFLLNSFRLFRFHTRRLLPPLDDSHTFLCVSGPNPRSTDEEDKGTDGQKMSSVENQVPEKASEFEDLASSGEEGFCFKQDEVRQWWCSLPACPSLPVKEEFIILPADDVSKSFTWEGWGTSLCWWANFAGGLSSDDRDHILDLLFDLKTGLGLNIVRYNIGGGADPGLNEYLRPFGHVPGLKPGPGTSFDWSADERQQRVLFGARDRGANVFEAFSNSPPYWMTLSGSVTGNARWGQDNLNPDYDEAFVDYLTEVVKYYKELWGLQFDYVAPFNEPVEGWWNINRKKKTAQEGCNFSVSSIKRLIPKLKKALVEKKLQSKISAFDAWSQNTVRVLQGMDEAVLSAIDQVNVHTYVFITSREEDARRKQVTDACASIGKKIWMSEYGPLNWRGEDIDVALGLGRHIALDLNELQASAWCYWQVLELPGSLWGLLQTSFTYDVQPINLTISKQFYVFMQFTKWIRPGFQIFPVDTFADRFLVAASFLDKSAVFVFINESTSYRDYSYDVSIIAPWLSTRCKMEATLFRTSATENHVRLPTLVFDFPIVMIRVNGRSVTTMLLSEGIS